MSAGGWIGVDFDSTLATYTGWVNSEHCGEPVPAMVERVKRWLAEGRDVRIFTARMFPFAVCLRPEDEIAHRIDYTDRHHDAARAVQAVRKWCAEHIGQVLPITCVKDYGMAELWDDRAVQVEANTGEIVGHSTRGLTDPAPRPWPKSNRVGRCGDMAPPGQSFLLVGMDGDADVYVQAEAPAGQSLEFCTYTGGGKSARTRQALIDLMLAIEADNAESPTHAWPPMRDAAAGTRGTAMLTESPNCMGHSKPLRPKSRARRTTTST